MDHPRLASDIMVTKLVTLTPDTNVFDGIARLLKYNLTGASVIDEQRNYLGVFSEKCCISVLTATAHLLASRNVTCPDAPRAKDMMATRLVTLTPDMDVFQAIHLLLKSRISGAPVIDKGRQFLGSFSEKSSMTVLLGAAHDQLPTSRVEAFMDKDRNRTIDEEKGLLSIAQMFLDTPYRRLPVLRDGALMGQISRRDVLRAAHSMSRYVTNRQDALGDRSARTSAGPLLENEELASFMDTSAKTIGQDVDLLSIAQIFRQTDYRRLPVLNEGKLAGQISRRDLLKATNDLIAISPRREKTLLYLSSLVDRDQAPIE